MEDLPIKSNPMYIHILPQPPLFNKLDSQHGWEDPQKCIISLKRDRMKIGTNYSILSLHCATTCV